MSDPVLQLANDWSSASPQLLNVVGGEEDFPAFVDFGAYIDDPPASLLPLIGDVLNKGAKLSINGASKSWKSWAALDLAISCASGNYWLGHKAAKSMVLFVNLELRPRVLVTCEC